MESQDPDNRAINNTAGNNDFIIGHRWLAINELNKGFFRALEDNKNLVLSELESVFIGFLARFL